MYKVRITAVRKTSYPDLIAKYENPIQHACDVQEGILSKQFSNDCNESYFLYL